MSAASAADLVIPGRFNGPPASGNGGYVAGRLAARLGPGPRGFWPEVSLRSPPPLDTPMTVRAMARGIGLYDGETLAADARWVVTQLDCPPAPDLGAAEDAVTRYSCRDEHPLPTCFTCGTARAPRDGLRLFTGPVTGAPNGLVAAPWTPDDTLVDETGTVRPEIIWAALDCPGAFAIEECAATGLKLLGRLSAQILERPAPGTACVVGGWYLGSEGRKHSAGTAVWRASDHALLACARALWIELKTA